MTTFSDAFKPFGFENQKSEETLFVGTPTLLHVRWLSERTVLIVEGKRKTGKSIENGSSLYVYSFYKRTYNYHGGHEDKMYLEDAHIITMVRKVEAFTLWLDTPKHKRKSYKKAK